MLTFSEIIEIIDRQEESNILIAALDLEVFTILDKNSMTAKNLARKAGTILEGTEPLLNALASMGALRKKGIFFSNTSESYKHLCAHSKEYKKGILMLKLDSQGEWTKLIKTIRNGRNLTEYEDDNENYEFTDMPIAQSPSEYWSYPSFPSHIDHIIITNELFNNHISTSTILIENALPNLSDYNNYISDHRPVGIKLSLEP